MPSKTRTPRNTTRTPQTCQRGEQANVVAFRTAAEDKLWETLHSHPNSTTAELSVAAKISKSTAQKILLRWAADGSVARTSGIIAGGRRAADLWTIAETNTATDCADTETDTDTEAKVPKPHMVEFVQTDPVQEEPVTPGDADTTDTENVTATKDETTQLAEAGTANCQPHTAKAETPDPSETTGPEPTELVTEATAGSAVTDNANSAHAGHPEPATAGGGTAQRLSPGALRGMVEDYLRDHPGEEFGPVTIAKSLGGKSSGAVSNALDKLVAAGTAVKTKEAPRRYALAPTEQAPGTPPAH